MSRSGVSYKIKDHIAHVVLDRPDSQNSLNRDTLDQLGAILSRCKCDETCRAVIVTGAGEKVFSAGADVRVFEEVMPNTLGVREWSRYGQTAFALFDNLGKPSIAAINGIALGGGFELALACTFRIASRSAKFGFSEIGLGFIPGWGGIVRVTRLAGKTQATELILTGGIIDAEEALRIGLVNRVVPPEDLMSASEEFAGKIIRNSPIAVRVAMEALDCAGDASFHEAMNTESNLAGLVCHSEDAKEGLRAFRERRNKQFRQK